MSMLQNNLRYAEGFFVCFRLRFRFDTSAQKLNQGQTRK